MGLTFEKMNIESWCAVECNSSQNWTRSDRKHCDKAFKSSVFNGKSNHYEGRVDFQQKVESDVHTQRRHYPEKRKLIRKDFIKRSAVVLI